MSIRYAKLIIVLLLLLTLGLGGFWVVATTRLSRAEQQLNSIKRQVDTIRVDSIVYVHDTIRLDSVQLAKHKHEKASYLTTIKVLKADIKNLATDTVQIPIPIATRTYTNHNTKHFDTDSVKFKITIKGYKPTIQSLSLSAPAKVIYKTKTVHEVRTITEYKKHRFSIGPSVGCTLDNGKLSPIISIGITYNLLNF